MKPEAPWLGNVFSIPAGCSFLKELVAALMDGRLIDGFEPANDPLLLSDATIYMPNRRAARALSTAFLDWFDGHAALLPVIRTLGDADDLDFGLVPDADELDLAVPPIAELDRQLQLAMLIQGWKDALATETRRLLGDEEILIPTSHADSIRLATDLANLLTQVTQEEIDWNLIDGFVSEDHAEWWRLTSSFLEIIFKQWPRNLSELGLLDPADRSVKILKSRAKKYAEKGAKGPVIVAGSTGSVPSTQLLLRAVAGLPNGAVVLPGVDFSIPAAEWSKLSDPSLLDHPLVESHPQFGLARTLSNLGSIRSNITSLAFPEPPLSTRNSIVSMALALSDFSADWKDRISQVPGDEIDRAFSGVSLIEAANERDEALAIAVALRETLVDPAKTAALVTPDRQLARRVSMELKRFGLNVDDTAGTPLSQMPIARFARKLLQVSFGKPDNSYLTGFLKDPLMNHSRARPQAMMFELIALRGSLTAPVIGKLGRIVQQRREEFLAGHPVSSAIKNRSDDEWEALIEWAEWLDDVLLPLVQLADRHSLLALDEVVEALKTALIQLVMDGGDIDELQGAEDLEAFFDEALNGRAKDYAFPPIEAPSVFDTLMGGRVIRTAGKTHSRLHIYGPLEIRLLEHDRVILAGLNEGSWPQTHRNDPFLNRTLRRQLGMPSPERRTGLAAHDFQQLMGKREVVLSRSERADKSPTVSSRWVQRLLALLGEKTATQMRKRGSRYLDLADTLDHPSIRSERCKRPNVTPPVDNRPKGLPVTDIELWIRDPYALYAKKILKLRPLDPLDRQPDNLLKGTVYHAVMEHYVLEGGPGLDPEERIALLSGLLGERLTRENLDQDIQAAWEIRFQEIACDYVAWEVSHQAEFNPAQIAVETKGKTRIAQDFTLTARADRIDVSPDGSAIVFDYKTGLSPSLKEARTLSPQLALEALIARQNGFEGVNILRVADMRFLRLRERGQIIDGPIQTKEQTLEYVIDRAGKNLSILVAAYQNPLQGYLSRYAPFMESEMGGDYDHLARVREWSFGEDDGDG